LKNNSNLYIIISLLFFISCNSEVKKFNTSNIGFIDVDSNNELDTCLINENYDDLYQQDHFFENFSLGEDLDIYNELIFLESSIKKIKEEINNPAVNLSSLIWCKMDSINSPKKYYVSINNLDNRMLVIFFTNTVNNHFKSNKIKFYIYYQLLLENLISKKENRDHLNSFYFGKKDSIENCNNFDIVCKGGELIYVKNSIVSKLDSLFENYFDLIKLKSIDTLIHQKITPLSFSEILLKKVYEEGEYDGLINAGKKVTLENGEIFYTYPFSSADDSILHPNNKWITVRNL
jgi:hypothetical protein